MRFALGFDERFLDERLRILRLLWDDSVFAENVVPNVLLDWGWFEVGVDLYCLGWWLGGVDEPFCIFVGVDFNLHCGRLVG